MPRAQPDIAIVGGGIAGLSAAAYAQMNGFDATVVEMAERPGGVCASWERHGYLVNGSIHWLAGSAPGSDLHDMWMELGVLDDHPHLTHARFGIYHDLCGVTLHLWRDPDRLEAHLSEVSPPDAALIADLCAAIRVFRDMDVPMDRAFELLSLADWIGIVARNMPMIMAHRRFSTVSLRDFAQRFQHPALRGMLEHFWHADMSMQFFLMQLGFAAKGTAAYPLGGSGPFIDRLVARAEQLGAALVTGTRVASVITEAGRACGVMLEDGQRIEAHHVVTACDAETVYSKLLGDQPSLRPSELDALDRFPPLCYFSAGVTHDFGDIPSSMMGHNIALHPPLVIGPTRHTRATVQIYTFDKTVSPEGGTLLTAMLESDYDWWKELRRGGAERYDAERDRVAAEIVAALDHLYPGLARSVVFSDLATPLTFERYTGNHRGAYEGWLPTPAAAQVKLPTHFKVVENFWMAGHWVAPGGGMPPAAYTGRNAIQLICAQEGRRFQVSRP
jgi:phytoene dehydrogenase-like protein